MIGRYAIRGRLGSGGMGVVYKAAMPVTGRIVALKLCRPADILLGTMGLDGAREFFLREAVAMASVRHPHVASILDVDEAEVVGLGRVPFFTMEYYCLSLGQLMGEDYDPVRPSRVLPVADALAIAGQMAEGLARLHWAGLVHRDVKPFNVLLDDDERVKLIDLGLSRLRGEPEKRPRGMVVGSPYYTAPEQEADADAADERSDVFSVGVTLFRMLTGLLPEDEAGARRRASTVNPGLDGRFDDLLERALHPDPARRHQGAAELAEELGALAGHWRRARAEACALELDAELEVDLAGNPAGYLASARRPRPGTVGRRVPPAHAREVFGLNERFEPRPGPRGPFELLPGADGTLLDKATGLFWQRSGSPYALTLDEAQQYVEKLNETRYAGREGWRLPTVDECCTLLTPGSAEGGPGCADPAFDQRQRRLWTSDAKSHVAHWYADAVRGFLWWQDDTCRFHARAVSGAPAAPGQTQAAPGQGPESD
ncbi:MAG: protein kinase [Desulfovibrionaceae bacterium]